MNSDIDHIGEREMTRYTTQGFAALAALLLAAGLWAPTVAPVTGSTAVAAAVMTAPVVA
ncbi:hypothetical protein [Croceicoccus marinus]|uniref:hypothetical protein n=1 Tax=Croceicoccus marinus TaxID=450378 RepID=UPI0012F708EB|nr:hypothetical protein [Croceicoccus marinus]